MDNYLVIAMDMGTTPPGVVFKTLARAMSTQARLTVVCPETDPSFTWDGIELIHPHHYHAHREKTIRRFWHWYNTNPDDNRWTRRAFREVMPELKGRSFNAVIIFVSMGYFPSLMLGKRIAQELGLPWYIYGVDGLPAPVEWMDSDVKAHDRIAHFLDSTCQGAKAFFSSNPFMAAYQRLTFPGCNCHWDYLYTPHTQNFSYPKTTHQGLRFIYTGTLYGLRKIDGLLSGFEHFEKSNPGAKLTFIGTVLNSYQALAQPLIEKGIVEILPFTPDLGSYFAQADVLVDIGADIPDDIYLSSKIISYLWIDRPILAVTGKNSPARNIFSDCPSIIHCSNDKDDVLRALEECSQAIGTGIEDRKPLRKLFDADEVASKLLNFIKGE